MSYRTETSNVYINTYHAQDEAGTIVGRHGDRIDRAECNPGTCATLPPGVGDDVMGTDRTMSTLEDIDYTASASDLVWEDKYVGIPSKHLDAMFGGDHGGLMLFLHCRYAKAMPSNNPALVGLPINFLADDYGLEVCRGDRSKTYPCLEPELKGDGKPRGLMLELLKRAGKL